MEELIKQAFLQVDVLGPHVQDGHYDLTGPNGEIILPSVWEKVIEPDWSITMTMWPVEKAPPVGPRMPMPPGGGRHHGHPPFPPGHGRMGGPPGVGPGGGRRSTGPGVNIPPPPGWAGPPGRGPPPNIINVDPHSRPSKSKRNSQNSAIFTFLAGKPKKK